MPITARLCMSERLDGGIELPEAIEIGKRLKEAGIDGVHTTVGTGTTGRGLASIFPTSFSAEAPFAPLAAEFKRATEDFRQGVEDEAKASEEKERLAKEAALKEAEVNPATAENEAALKDGEVKTAATEKDAIKDPAPTSKS